MYICETCGSELRRELVAVAQLGEISTEQASDKQQRRRERTFFLMVCAARAERAVGQIVRIASCARPSSLATRTGKRAAICAIAAARNAN